MADSTRLVNLDADPTSRAAFSLAALEVASQGDSRSGEASRSALAAYREEVSGGASVTDAASVASRVLRASLKG